VPTSRPRLSHDEYLAQVERLAHAVCNEAVSEGWLDLTTESDEGHTALQRSINELARTLRHVHYDGDGCLDH
jgi:hypothetical protein